MRVDRCFAFVDLCGFTAFTERYGDEHTVVVLASFRTTLREIAARRGVRITKWLGDGAMLSSPDTEATVAMVLEVAAHADTMLVMPAMTTGRFVDSAPAAPVAGTAATALAKRPANPARSTMAPAPNALGAPTQGGRPPILINPGEVMDERLAIRAGLARGPVIMFEGDDYIGRATNIASRLCDSATPGQVLATREVASIAPRWVAASEALPYPVRGFDRPLEAVRLAIASSATMVTDPTCGLNIPQVSGLVTRWKGDGVVEHFCSAACALAWEQAQRQPGPSWPG